MDGSTRRGTGLLLTALLLMALPIVATSALAQESGVSERDTSADAQSPLSAVSESPQQETLPNQVIVKFKPSENAIERADTRREEGLKKIRDVDFIQAEVAEVEGRSAIQAARDLESRPDVEYADPNRFYYASGYADEPRFGELWGLNNTGQPDGTGAAGLANVDIDGLEASAVTQGTPELVVAVIDDGVDFSHPDLRDRAWVNPGEIPDNGVDDDLNGCDDDVNGCNFQNQYRNGLVYGPGEAYHGTHVAGTLAASVNGEGVVGVAPNVKIMAVKFMDSEGSGTLEDVLSAVAYAAENGANIANASWSASGPPDQSLKDAIEQSGILFVAAAGNQGNDLDVDADPATEPHDAAYPAAFDSFNVLSVAAANNRGELWASSNYGAVKVDISAPGEEILSTVPGGGWDYLSGTSMAAPHATGAAALAASAKPSLLEDPMVLKRFVLDNAKPLPASTGKTATSAMINANLDTVAPAVNGTVPATDTQQVAVYDVVEAEFSEDVRAGTINTDTFTLIKQGSTALVAARVTYDAVTRRAVLDPDADLAFSSTYSATVRGGDGGVKDYFDNALATDKVWSFTTASQDLIAPQTTITSGPSGYATSNSASFAFSSTEPRSTFSCRIDWESIPPSSSIPPPFQPCDSPKAYSSLGEGLHMFEVKALDYAGNSDQSPAYRTFFVDTVAPNVNAPVQAFIAPSSLSYYAGSANAYSILTKISWSGYDPGGHSGSGTTRYELQRSVNGGAWSDDLLQQQPVNPGKEAPVTSTSLSSTLGYMYKYRVRAQDLAGNWSGWIEGPSLSARGYDQGHTSVTYPTGTWTRVDSAAFYAGAVKYATAAGARARFSFTAREVGWVSTKGPNRGKAEVWVDGTKVAVVDLYSPTVQPREVVFRRAWATSGSHAAVVVLTGTKNASSTNPRVDIDGFVTLQ